MSNKLIEAVKDNNVELVKELLKDKNIDVNANDDNGDTALTCAAYQGYKDIVKLLLEHNDIDVNAKDGMGRDAYIYATYHRHKDIVNLIDDYKLNNIKLKRTLMVNNTKWELYPGKINVNHQPDVYSIYKPIYNINNHVNINKIIKSKHPYFDKIREYGYILAGSKTNKSFNDLPHFIQKEFTKLYIDYIDLDSVIDLEIEKEDIIYIINGDKEFTSEMFIDYLISHYSDKISEDLDDEIAKIKYTEKYNDGDIE